MSDAIQNYYDNYDEDGRLLKRYGQVEYLTTMRYIDKYLTNGAKILEIGAGTGRYSHSLALRGFEVDAVEYSPHNFEIFKSKTTPEEKITVRLGDARDLSAFADDTYNITLLLGPLYHMFTVEDKKQTISEALRVTKPGGVVFAAYCISDASIMASGFKLGLFNVAEFVEKGFINTETFEVRSEPELIFELVRKEQIDALMSVFPVSRLHFVATDLYTKHFQETVEAMDDETFALYLQYHFAICERPDMTGLSHHTLDVFRKNV